MDMLLIMNVFSIRYKKVMYYASPYRNQNIVFKYNRRTQQVTKWLDVSMRRTSWLHHQLETFSALLALCTGISPVTGEFLSQRPMTQSFGVFFDRRFKQTICETIGAPVVLDAIALIMTSL